MSGEVKVRKERTKRQLEAIASGRLDPKKLDMQLGNKRWEEAK